jgi:hypothetical protein
MRANACIQGRIGPVCGGKLVYALVTALLMVWRLVLPKRTMRRIEALPVSSE